MADHNRYIVEYEIPGEPKKHSETPLTVEQTKWQIGHFLDIHANDVRQLTITVKRAARKPPMTEPKS